MHIIKPTKEIISIIIIISFFTIFTTNLKGQFILNGTVIPIDETCYRLTPAAPNSIASIWKEDQISLANSFDLSFNMNFGCTDIGADGMVFVLNTSSSTLGQSGGDIGYGSNFNPSVGIEFDTYDNIVNADFAADHIAIQKNGNVNHTLPNNLAGPVNASSTAIDIEDCAYHPVRIVWNAGNTTLEVYFDCILRLTYTGDIVNEIFGGDPMVFWGFTASTGGKTNVQSICFDSFETTASGTNQTLSICEGEDIQLNASQSNATYSWTPITGLSNATITNPIASPQENITYIATGLDICDNEFNDTFNIIVNALEINYELQPALTDINICDGEVLDLMLQTDANNNILWQDGSSDTAFSISQAGTYEVTISNDCSTTTVNLEVESSNCKVSMPNAFTPDSDGVNDFFAPVSESIIEILQFKIFNRWGEVVYEETNLQGWDGTVDGIAATSDVYVYIIEYIKGSGEKESLSGDVTLLR